MDIKKISTKDLVEELEKRAGVETVNVNPYDKCELSIEGPAIVLKVID